MTRAELLAAVIAERADMRWWKTPEPVLDEEDNDITTARRRRHLADDYDRLRKVCA